MPLRLVILVGTWAFLWSGAFIAVKIALDDAGPFTVVAIRCVCAGLILSLFTWRAVDDIPPRGFAGIAAVGLLNNAGYLGLIAVALPHLSTGMAAILTSTTPLAVLSISALQGERLRMVQWAGCILGFLGVAGSGLARMGSADTSMTGIGIGAVAVTCLIAGTSLTPKLVPPGSPWLSTGLQSLAGGIPCAAIALALDPAPEWSASLIGALAFLVIGASVVGMTLWLTIIRTFGPSRAATGHFLPPLISMALGAAILAEYPSKLAIAMVIPAAAGVVLATRGGSPGNQPGDDSGAPATPAPRGPGSPTGIRRARRRRTRSSPRPS